MDLSANDIDLVSTTIYRVFPPQQAEKAESLPFTSSLAHVMADIDFRFFCLFFLPHHFYRPFAQMHLELISDLEIAVASDEEEYLAEALPRGYAKSTICNMAFPLWCALTGKKHYIILTSDSQEQSKEHLATIKDELEHNERIREVFGDLVGAKWQADHIELAGMVCCIEALGAGMKIRGRKFRQHRPDLIVFDDLENITSVESDSGRALLRRKFFRSYLRAGGDRTLFLAIGTVIHHDSLIANILKNPMFKSRKYKAIVSWSVNAALWEEWKQIITDIDIGADAARMQADAYFERHKKAMLEGTEVTWEARHTYYDLMLILVLDPEGSGTFFAEMQNEPLSPEEIVFTHIGDFYRDWREGEVYLVPVAHGAPVPLSACALFGFCDPSLGKNKQSDMSAIIILALAPTGRGFILEADIARRVPSVIIHDILEWAKVYMGMTVLGVEANGFQVLLRENLNDEAARRGIYLNTEPVSHTGNKDLRIKSLQMPLANDYLLLERGKQQTLRDQLEGYPKAALKDGPDALEGAWVLATTWEGTTIPVTLISETFQFGQSQPVGMAEVPSQDDYDSYSEYTEREPVLCQACRGKGCEACGDAGFVWRDAPKIFVPMIVG